MLSAIKFFVFAFLAILIVNQMFYGGCFAAHCLAAAFPKVLILSLVATAAAHWLSRLDTANAKAKSEREREWRAENRQTTKGGKIYVYNIPARNWFKVGMTAWGPADRVIEYTDRYGFKADHASLRSLSVPPGIVTADVEEYVRDALPLRGFDKQREIIANEVFVHGGDYEAAVSAVAELIGESVSALEAREGLISADRHRV